LGRRFYSRGGRVRAALANHVPPTRNPPTHPPKRQIEFLRPLSAGILSERRSTAPFGLAGGGDAEKGVNLLVRAGGRTVNLGGKATARVGAGDVLRILTPGGGGFGKARGGGSKPAGSGVAADLVESEAEGGAAAAAAAPVVVERGSVHAWRMMQESA